MSGLIDSAFAASAYQLSSLWDFTIQGVSDDASWPDTMTFQVEDVGIPFARLVTEQLANGENYYSGIEFPKDVTLTLRETLDFKALNYFNSWFGLVYDLEKRTFISYPGKKGDSDDKIHRQGLLRFKTFDMSQDSKSTKIQEKETTQAFSGAILHQEEMTNILLGVANNILRSASSMVNDVTRLLGKNVSLEIPVPTRKMIDLQNSPAFASSRSKDASVGGWDEKVSYSVSMDNLSILGVEDLSLSYGEAGALLVKVNMVAENVVGSAPS